MLEVKTPAWKKLRLGQGRAGLKRKVKERISQPNKPVQIEPILLERQKSEISTQCQSSVGPTPQKEHIPLIPTASKVPLNPRWFAREVPSYSETKLRPPPRLQDLKESQRIQHTWTEM